MEDIPGNSHFEANILTSYMTNQGSDDPNWLNNCLCTYVLLKPNSSYLSVNEKFNDLIIKYIGPQIQQFLGLTIKEFIAQGNKYRFFLQNLTDIHLDTSIQGTFNIGDLKIHEDIRQHCCPDSFDSSN